MHMLVDFCHTKESKQKVMLNLTVYTIGEKKQIVNPCGVDGFCPINATE